MMRFSFTLNEASHEAENPRHLTRVSSEVSNELEMKIYINDFLCHFRVKELGNVLTRKKYQLPERILGEYLL